MIEDFAGTLAAAQAGDEAALGALWLALNHRVLRFFRARRPEAAEDLASETWVTVAAKLGQFDGNEVEFRAWLFAVARSRLVDSHRRRGRRPETLVAPASLPDGSAVDDPEAQALAALDREHVLAVIGRLPPDQGDVILLRLVAELDVAQVAGILGKRAGAVRMLQLRGLRTLAELLGDPDRTGVTR
jgi:RNA polymerase sigma-70 factor (ECF subfamily)